MHKFLFFLLVTTSFFGQESPRVKVVEEAKGNRMAFYAYNEDHRDFDVLFKVKGTNFRQSAAKPRWIRIPSASKVHLKTIILLRNKKPQYNYTLDVNDSLSRRALKKEYTPIEIPPKMIQPKKHITIYVTETCPTCDSIIDKLNRNHYIFKSIRLSEKPKIKEYLSNALQAREKPLDSLQNPIINLGGYLYTWIKDYDMLLEELNKE
ncbi:glutaredoxin domain-containing protein [Allomuricauda sp. SCSIO 65647]|uniref:glutaredoxin domain-containing protein n=1 Tax=Allomuricauda sp. SCSIO 65647 TaxID=2908843 RepID=UPI001F1E94E1|nr:glutaredoxin domain-containing protein [Muricauda sp. SCSIO 65647]UJH67326.1 hypothetical protein L0P89_15425 [Muricauda sp. SCSIO 65647]